jgi:hypothetical protein
LDNRISGEGLYEVLPCPLERWRVHGTVLVLSRNSIKKKQIPRKKKKPVTYLEVLVESALGLLAELVSADRVWHHFNNAALTTR